MIIYLVNLKMLSADEILIRIKQLVKQAEPSATVILFGSQARGDNSKESDIDLLILVDQDQISYEDEKKIKYPLYDLEFETGKVISPIVIGRKDWETIHSITPFYESIQKEGVML